MNVTVFFSILIGMLLPLSIVGVIIYFMVTKKEDVPNNSIDEPENIIDQQIKNEEILTSENVKHFAFPTVNEKPAYKNANHKSKKIKVKNNDEDFYNYKKYVSKWDTTKNQFDLY